MNSWERLEDMVAMEGMTLGSRAGLEVDCSMVVHVAVGAVECSSARPCSHSLRSQRVW